MTSQYLVAQIKTEFKNLDKKLGASLPSDKLTPFTTLLSSTQRKILSQLQTQYVGSVKGIRSGIRSNLRVGIRATLLKGFGGQDLGNY